jgi:phosphoribosylanthranilate isomerase
MHIKICGITSTDDALAAIDAGATHLGFNFYPKSPRYILPEQCLKIQSTISNRQSAIVSVGLFVNENPATILQLLNDCHLALAQIHSDDSPEALRPLQGRFYKAFRGDADGADFDAFATLSGNAPALLIDAHVPGSYGGTGQLADWAAARAIAQRYPLFLAGGLTPDNVAAAIAQVQPWGVDVASGVESAPGRKDSLKMKAFVEQARERRSEASDGSKGAGENQDSSPLLPHPPAPPLPEKQ